MATNPEYLRPDEDEEEVVTGSATLSKIEEADRSHMIRTARENPRKITQFVKELTEIACLSQPTAMAMIYSLPRAGKQIVGPSVRFAEAVLACWGNARAGVEVIDVDRRELVVTCEGRYYDCEKNVGIALRKRRRIVAKTINADAIQITGDAGSSIALRDAILRGVPKAIWEPIWEQAKKTAVGEAASMEKMREGLLGHFNRLGITTTQVFNALEVPGIADIGPDQVLALNAWKKQLAEGECTIEDIFGSPLDEEIDKVMASLEWSDTKKRMSRDSYRGRRDELLKYVREQAKLAGKEQPVTEKVTPIKQEQAKAEPAKEADTTTSPQASGSQGGASDTATTATTQASNPQPPTKQRQAKITW